MTEEMKMDRAISDFFRVHYNRDWKPAEQVEFLIELFSNLSLHVRPVFPSDEKMVLVTSQMMEEALKRRKVRIDFGEVKVKSKIYMSGKMEEKYLNKAEVYNRKNPSGVLNIPAYRIKPRVMVLKGGSDALHLMGNIGREADDLINIVAEDECYYIGTFCEGFGFFDVHFLKENVRPMNKEEVEKLNRTYHTISGRVLGKNHYDTDGYWIGNQESK